MCNESHLELISRYANLRVTYGALIEHRKRLDAEISRLEVENRCLWNTICDKSANVWAVFFGDD